jgi:hypothetical protein
MSVLTITTDFPYYHKGYERKDYQAGQSVETDDEEFAAVAVAEGWAELGDGDAKAEKPRSKKAHTAAPENKAAE